MKNKKTKYYKQNLGTLLSIVIKCLDSDDKTYDALSSHIGLISSIAFISASQFIPKLIETNVNFTFSGNFIIICNLLFFLSIILSMVAKIPRSYRSPNISYEDGLAEDTDLQLTEIDYNEKVLKELIDTSEHNKKINEEKAQIIKYATILLISGLLLILISLIIPVINLLSPKVW